MLYHNIIFSRRDYSQFRDFGPGWPRGQVLVVRNHTRAQATGSPRRMIIGGKGKHRNETNKIETYSKFGKKMRSLLI